MAHRARRTDDVSPEATVGTLEWALHAPPSAAVLVVLDKVDPSELPGDVRVDLIRAWERAASWLAARQHVALASVAQATQELGLDGHLARHEVGVALRLAPGTAYDRCERAEQLTGRLARTLAALHAGQISLMQAWALADAVRGRDDKLAAALQERVLRYAPNHTNAQTRALIARALISLDPATAAERALQAYTERTVTRQPLDDTMSEIRAVLAAPDAQRVWAALSAQAATQRDRLRAAGGPASGQTDPGIDALRADALVAAVLRPAPVEPGGATPRIPAQIQVSIDAVTLLGLAEHPAQLRGYGPIPAPVARELAADGEWVRFITDPQTGQLLDINTRVYRPSPKLAAFVRAAHPECAWPTCRQPSVRCDLDHIVNYNPGPTNRANLGPFCRQHHNAKTHGRWTYRRNPDNTGHLRSPLGHTYTIPPPEHPPLE